MADACCRLGSEQIAGGGLEELQYHGVLEGGRVRHIYHHARIGQGVSESLAGEDVDASVRRRRDRLVAVFAELGDELDPIGPPPMTTIFMMSPFCADARPAAGPLRYRSLRVFWSWTIGAHIPCAAVLPAGETRDLVEGPTCVLRAVLLLVADSGRRG